MMDTICLSERLLTLASQALRMGRKADVVALLRQTLTLRQIPIEHRFRALILLAEIRTELKQDRLARRHLVKARRLFPNHSDVVYRLACVLEADPRIDPRLALKYFRLAVKRSPQDAASLSGCGHAFLKLELHRQALQMFRRAAKTLPESFDLIEEVLDGFCTLGSFRDATKLLNGVRFRTGRTTRLESLFNTLRFRELRQAQISERQPDTIPVTLPFLRPAEHTGKAAGGRIIRRDHSSRSTPHLLRLSSFRPRFRHAP